RDPRSSAGRRRSLAPHARSLYLRPNPTPGSPSPTPPVLSPSRPAVLRRRHRSRNSLPPGISCSVPPALHQLRQPLVGLFQAEAIRLQGPVLFQPLVNASYTIVHHFALKIPATGRLIWVCRREHGDDRLDLRGRAHRLAFLLPLQHQPVTRGAAPAFWRRSTPARQTHRRVIAVASCFRVENPKLPFPKIHSSAGVEKGLPGPQLEIPHDCPMHPRPSEKTGELPTV